jgi:hypothetical protein
MPDWTEIHNKLTAPFRLEELGTNNESKGGGPYVDARSVAERLDEAVGPGSWSTSFRLIDAASGAVECVLTIHGVAKSDLGYPNEAIGFKRLPTEEEIAEAVKSLKQEWQRAKYRERVVRLTYLHPATAEPCLKIGSDEPLKAAYSDAFKRASVQWGIARYLYPYPTKRPREANHGQDDDSSRADDGDPPNHTTNDPARGILASTPQLNAIEKLARLLGRPENADPDQTSHEASTRITDLSREYNERKGTVRRSA